jgi:hypothetical protein
MSILELGKTASFYGGKWTIPFRPKRANSMPLFEKKPVKEKKKRKNIFKALIKVSRSEFSTITTAFILLGSIPAYDVPIPSKCDKRSFSHWKGEELQFIKKELKEKWKK